MRGWEAGEGFGGGLTTGEWSGCSVSHDPVCHGGSAWLRDHDHSRANDGAWSEGHALPRHQYTAASGRLRSPRGNGALQSEPH